MTRFIDQTSQFLTLVGLTSLLVGGIGVANGVRAWLDARARTIATLRCLGASARHGVRRLPDPGAGAGGRRHRRGIAGRYRRCRCWPWRFCRACCRCRRSLGVYPAPLLLAACYGLLTALAFALWPLGRAARIPGARAVPRCLAAGAHRAAWQAGRGQRRAGRCALIALTVATATDRRFALYFCGAALATLLLFRLGGVAVTRLARAAAAPDRTWARAGRGQPAPPRQCHRTAAGFGRPGPVHARVGGADRGQCPPGDPGAIAGQCAELLLRRYPERPACPLRADRPCRRRGWRTSSRCRCCAPASSR